MADKVEKPKKSKPKPKKDEKGVLAALPSTRPQRIGSRRASAPKTFEQPSEAARRQPVARPPAETGSAQREAGAARAAAAPGRTKPAAKRPAAKRAAAAKTTAAPPRPAREPRPRAVREGAPGMGTSGGRDQRAPAPGHDRSEAGSSEHGRPSGVELVTTAVQAAGELTQIGLTIGGKILKRAVDRLPKP